MGRKERARGESNDLARQLIDKEGPLTPAALEQLRRYSGYGGLYDYNLGQFYTPGPVAQFVVDLLGIEPGTDVLEPSAGRGVLLEYLPEDCRKVAVEIDRTAARICQLLHPSAQVICAPFEEAAIPGLFDYVIGNPPYGLDMVAELPWESGKRRKTSSEAYFLLQCLGLLKPGGTLAFVLPESILAGDKYRDLRKWVMENYMLKGVVSLPTQTFAATGTTVKTSVLVIQREPEWFVRPEDSGDFKVLVAMATEIGWDSRGRKTDKNDLPQLLAEFRKFRATEWEDQLQRGRKVVPISEPALLSKRRGDTEQFMLAI